MNHRSTVRSGDEYSDHPCFSSAVIPCRPPRRAPPPSSTLAMPAQDTQNQSLTETRRGRLQSRKPALTQPAECTPQPPLESAAPPRPDPGCRAPRPELPRTPVRLVAELPVAGRALRVPRQKLLGFLQLGCAHPPTMHVATGSRAIVDQPSTSPAGQPFVVVLLGLCLRGKPTLGHRALF